MPLIDVPHVEEVSGGPTLTVANLPTLNKLAFMAMSQRFHLGNLMAIMKQAVEGCREIRDIVDDEVRKHLKFIGSADDWCNVAK